MIRSGIRKLGGSTLGLIVAILVAGSAADGQVIDGELVAVNSDIERYLRALQVAGRIPLHPWSIRAFGPREIERLVGQGVRHRGDIGRGSRSGAFDFQPIAGDWRAIYNSRFPFGYNDGAIWAGKGLTNAVSAGFAARAGPLSMVINPVFFRAENDGFELVPTGLADAGQYRNPYAPGAIDLPQRFGDGAYQRIDPGQSWIRLDLGPVAIGASTANQHWGPAIDHPVILGNNAAGFRHAFVGTSQPLDLWIARVSGRLQIGQADQSAYSPQTGEPRRVVNGLTVVVTPRWLDGLELGGSRFFHNPWPVGGVKASDILEPFGGILKADVAKSVGGDGTLPDNQLGSVFFRWVVPGAGAEIYGEFGREDHNVDLRDALLQPDHISATMVGVQRVWTSDRRMFSLRAETQNSRITHLQRTGRGQSPFGVHSPVYQGHTSHGEALGSTGMLGGSAATIAADVFGQKHRLSVALTSAAVAPPAPGVTAGGRWAALSARRVQSRGSHDFTVGGAYIRRSGAGSAGNGIRLETGGLVRW